MKKTKIFINLSNHPSENWTPQQMKTARALGEVEDIPFPNISPDLSHEEVQALADHYASMMADRMRCELLTVHVMGEMTFTYAVVTRLKEMGIPCVASTTERHSTETVDGRVISEFRFVTFRSY